jgi:hypothetical protein
MGPEQSGEWKVRQSPSRIGRAAEARYSGDLEPGDFSNSLIWIAVFSCPIFRSTTAFTAPGGNSTACSSSCFFSAARGSSNECGIERLRCMTPHGYVTDGLIQYIPELVPRLSCSRLGATVMRAIPPGRARFVHRTRPFASQPCRNSVTHFRTRALMCAREGSGTPPKIAARCGADATIPIRMPAASSTLSRSMSPRLT